MREIKFRARRLNTGEWVYGNLVIGSVSCQIYTVNDEEIHVDPKTVGQYTGLKDKTGRDIYEGDVFEDHCWDKSPPQIGVVEWVNDYANSLCGFYVIQGEDINGNMAGWQTERIEVIGNIYENKELLE